MSTLETNIASTSGEFKHKSRVSFSENSSSRDGTSSNNGTTWTEREHRRDHGKRERSRDSEWSRDRNYHGKSRESFREEENRDRFREDQQQPTQPQQQQQTPQQATNFPAYSYAAADHSFVDSNRRAMTMMNYNFMAAMGSPWGVSPIDGMAMTQNNLAVNPSQPAVPVASGMEMNQTSAPGINPYAFMGMSGDTNMYGMMGMGNYYGMMSGQENVMINPVKETLVLTKCTLIPPSPNAPPPTTRGKPLGCKTIFVGGLPEKATEEVIKEIFERCGEIITIRMSKRNFCHIRFANESFVENAMYFSGYKIKVENKDETGYTGRLHVDYAQARDDQYEYECQQRALQREARHRERLEQDYYQPPTPPPVVHYSDHEATVLGEKLRGEETFQNAVFILITWLERGECNKRNAGSFYSMIQSTNSHVRRLMNEKSKYEEELTKAKMMLKKQMQGILLQFNEIGKVFNAACLQKVWDHFTKAQRKNIELWKKQTEEIKNAHVEEVLNDRIEDEMDLSDDDDNSSGSGKKSENNSEQSKRELAEEIRKLREENYSLKCQVQAVENEILVIQADHAKLIQEKDLEMHKLKQAFSQTNYRYSKKLSNDEEAVEFCPLKKIRCEDVKEEETQTEVDSAAFKARVNSCTQSISQISTHSISESEARIIGVVSAFLQVHPFGASVDYICSYLHMIDPSIKSSDLVNLLQRFPTVFREDSTGIGASLGKVWKFLGFNKPSES